MDAAGSGDGPERVPGARRARCPAGRRPVRGMTDVNSLRVRLWRRYAELGGDLAEIEADLREPLDADFAEQANELEEQVALEALESRKLREMADIRAALARIADGSYGTCVVCGEPIAEARLQALPTAITCIGCAGKGEQA